MRKKHKNELFQLLASTKYGINRFELIEDTSSPRPLIIIDYKNTPFQFTARNSSDDFELFDYQFVKYAPSFPLSGFVPVDSYISFPKLLERINRWLDKDVSDFYEDQEGTDLWEDFKSGNKSLNLDEVDFGNKSEFSLDEKQQIKLSLNELKLLIHRDLETTEEEQKIVTDRLDYLIEASGRLNRFDWKGLAASSLVSLSIALSLDTEKGRLLFELFKRVFSIILMLTN